MAYCDRCDRYFVYESALEQHRRDSNQHWPCYQCDRDFASWSARHQHYAQSWQHHYCRDHEELFDDAHDLKVHYDDEHFYCWSCESFFSSASERDTHRRTQHFYCGACDAFFASRRHLDEHRQSSRHQPRCLPCPAHACAKQFISRVHIILHFQEGGCASGLGRADAERALVRADPEGLLTDGYYDPHDCTWACLPCNRDFATPRALCSHLVSSQKHRGDTWRCPQDCGGCEARFEKPGAVLQHIRSKSCGVNTARFGKIAGVIKEACSLLGDWADE